MSDANGRRPVAVFAQTFELLVGQLDRYMRGEAKAMVRLIDSTPIPLGKLCDWAKSNGRIRGMKMHVVYDPDSDCQRVLDITDANVNDAQVGRTVTIEAFGLELPQRRRDRAQSTQVGKVRSRSYWTRTPIVKRSERL